MYNPTADEAQMGYKAYPLLCSINYMRSGQEGYEFGYGGPLGSLSALAKSTMMSGRIADLPSPAGPNLSYSLHFRAPQLSCTDTIINETVTEPYPYSSRFESEWNRRGRRSNADIKQGFASSYSLSWSRYFGWFVDEGQDPLRNFTTLPVDGTEFAAFEKTGYEVYFATENRRLECDLNSKHFDVDISFVDNFQHIAYTSNDPQPLILLYGGGFATEKYIPPDLDSRYWPFNSVAPSPRQPGPSAILDDGSVIWPELKAALESWSEFAIVGSLFTHMEYSWTINHIYASNNYNGEWKLDNRTVVKLKQLYHSFGEPGEEVHLPTQTPFEDSIFDPQRFERSDVERHEQDIEIIIGGKEFDPRLLNISEASINELLINITVSTLTLGIQRGMVPVTTKEYRNTYQFSEKLNFFLPYSVCLGTALFFILVAIRALINNGVPAADGGFLQIMMATRGRTEMERLVLKEGIVGTGDLSQELLNLKIRFGELIDMETTEKGASRPGTVGAGFAGPDNAMGEGAGFASVAVAESVASDSSATTAAARSACPGTVSTESLTGDTAPTSTGTTSLASLTAVRDNTAITTGVIRDFDTGMVGEGSRLVYRRVIGFGTVDETLPLRRKTQQTDITRP